MSKPKPFMSDVFQMWVCSELDLGIVKGRLTNEQGHPYLGFSFQSKCSHSHNPGGMLHDKWTP